MKDNSKFGSSQSLIDAVNEVLKGGQKKLDKNNNGKLDSEDFKKLRGEDHEVKPASNAQVGDKVHAGIGRKGGAGYSGVITKVDDTHAYIKVGETGKFGDRIVKAPHKLVTNYSRISEVAENLPMRKESALGDLLGSEKGVRKISPRKDEYGNEIKNPARSLARKAMKSFAAKAMELPMRKEDAVMKVIRSMRAEHQSQYVSESGGTLEYSGSVNKKDYKMPVSGGKQLDDYSDTGLHRLLRKHNPHLEHHEVSAIVNSGGEDASKETVVHKGKTYTHDVVNHQEPRRLD